MEKPESSRRPSLARHAGASAVEFALLFPILFAMMYSAIVYSYAYVLRQSINFAAQEAAEAAVDVQPGIANYDEQVTTTATNTANSVLSWMPTSLRANIATDVQFCADGGASATACTNLGPDDDAVVVTVNLPMTGNSQLFATITLPFVGTFPPLPATMSAQGVARV